MKELDEAIKRVQQARKEIDEIEKQLGIIRQPSPVFDAGMWCDWDIEGYPKELLIVLDPCNITEGCLWSTLNVLGEKKDYNVAGFKPHTFTESDLSLLNTDEVKYELKKVGKKYYVYSQNTNEKGGEKIGSMYDTIHDAIKPEFDERVAMNLLRKQIGEK